MAEALVTHISGRRAVKISVPDQTPHMIRAPSKAPLLLPLPPAISMTQTRNVPNIGSKAEGLMKVVKWA